MPSADFILQGLATIATEWWGLAVAWHVYFGLIAAALIAGWRPEQRNLGLCLVLPLISVSALAWLHWNPFNGTAIAGIGLVLLVTSVLMGSERAAPGPWWAVVAGVLLFGFGWGYPHFLNVGSWWPYLYSAPAGLLPCPTLAILTGLSLIFGSFGSRGWAWILGIAGLAFGLFGALYLGVVLDWVLAAGSVILVLTGHYARRVTAALPPGQASAGELPEVRR